MRAYRNDGEEAKEAGELLIPNIGVIEAFKPDYFTEFQVWRHYGNRRVEGQYFFGSASAELNPFDADRYKLEMKFARIEDGQRLYALVRSGKILPGIRYDGIQHATITRQFVDILRELRLLINLCVRQWIMKVKSV